MIVLEPQRRNSKEVPAHLLLGYEKVLSEADVSLLATWSCPGSDSAGEFTLVMAPVVAGSDGKPSCRPVGCR